jgi:ubiquinone/menaquinone biosynthesis C-methylase UbiE
MHEKQFSGEIERLRNPDRVKRLEVERVVSLCLEDLEPMNVLDIGVGSGLFAEAFSKQGLEVAGVDINPAMIPVAKQYVPQGDFRLSPAEVLPYPDQSFDLVFMGLLLHESDEPLKVLQEACRVARLRVCILEWPYEDNEFGPPLAHRLKPSEIEDLAKGAGYAQCEAVPLTHVVLYRLTV